MRNFFSAFRRVLFTASLIVAAVGVHAQRPPSPVVIYTASDTRFYREIEALGTVRASESVELTSLVTERVSALHFDDGQRVAKGELLVEFDQREEKALAIAAKARLHEAERQLKRLNSLVETDAATESLLDQRRVELETAQAEVEIIASRIDERQIIAPFPGLVGLRNISVGALVRAGERITTIDDDRVMNLDFNVPALFLNVLEPGAEIEARSAVYPEVPFMGSVASLSSRVDPVTRAVPVRAKIPNEDGRLRAGMLLTVVLRADPRERASVPEQSLLISATEQFLYVVNALPDTADTYVVEKRVVQTGARQGGLVEIIAGLDVGERVISHGVNRVTPGQNVVVAAEQKNLKQPLGDLLNLSLLNNGVTSP